MKKEEAFNIDLYGARDIAREGINGLISSVESDGMAFITRYGKPVALVLPVDIAGLKKMTDRIRGVLDKNRIEDKRYIEYLELQNTMLKLFEVAE